MVIVAKQERFRALNPCLEEEMTQPVVGGFTYESIRWAASHDGGITPRTATVRE
jgi:hypothetical protein